MLRETTVASKVQIGNVVQAALICNGQEIGSLSFRVVSWIVFFEPNELIHEITLKDAKEVEQLFSDSSKMTLHTGGKMECTTANEPARIEGLTPECP